MNNTEAHLNYLKDFVKRAIERYNQVDHLCSIRHHNLYEKLAHSTVPYLKDADDHSDEAEEFQTLTRSKNNVHIGNFGELYVYFLIHSNYFTRQLNIVNPQTIMDAGYQDQGIDFLAETELREPKLQLALQVKYWRHYKLHRMHLTTFTDQGQLDFNMQLTRCNADNPFVVFTSLPTTSIDSSVTDKFNVFSRSTFELPDKNNSWWEEFIEFIYSAVPIESRFDRYFHPEKHQQEPIDALELMDTGRTIVRAACGSGKTLIAERDIQNRIRQGGKNFIFTVPRKILAEQFFIDFYRQIEEKYSCYGFISTDRANECLEHGKYTDENGKEPLSGLKGTNPKKYLAFMASNSKPKITFVIYDSLDKLYDIFKDNDIPLDTLYLDEAHNSVPASSKSLSKTGFNAISDINGGIINRQVSLTATKKITEHSEYTMSNELIYGKDICNITHAFLRDLGKVVDANLNILTTEQLSDDLDSYVSSLAKGVADYRRKQQRNKKNIRSSNVLVFTKNSVLMDEYIKCFSKKFKKTDVFGISQDTDSYARKKILEDFQASTDAILISCNTLSEGVDIVKASCVVIGRVMNEISIVQAVCRALRITPSDRKAFKAGTIKRGNKQGWEKHDSDVFICTELEKGAYPETVIRMVSDLLRYGCLGTVPDSIADEYEGTNNKDKQGPYSIEDFNIEPKLMKLVTRHIIELEKMEIVAEINNYTSLFNAGKISQDDYLSHIATIHNSVKG